MKYANRRRTRQTFTLTELEHRGAKGPNERLVCRIQGDSGLLAIWGTHPVDMAHIQALESAMSRGGFPITLECDWIQPDAYEAEHFGQRYWVCETDYFRILWSTRRAARNYRRSPDG
jgi:hypothetical protein